MKKVLLTLLVAGTLVGGATSSFAAATAKPSVKPMTGTTTAKPSVKPMTGTTTAKPSVKPMTTAKPMKTAKTKTTK